MGTPWDSSDQSTSYGIAEMLSHDGVAAERFVPVHLSSARVEIDKTCAALEMAGIAVTVEHIVFETIDTEGSGRGLFNRSTSDHKLPGFRVLTPASTEQRARGIINRVLEFQHDASQLDHAAVGM